MTRSRLGLVTVASLLAMLLAVLVAAPADAVGPQWRTRMLEKVNAVRASVGVAPVRECAALEESAERYAKVMAQSGVVGHIGPDGSTLLSRISAAGYHPKRAGENLAGGQQTVVQVMRAWRASPAHLAVMTDPQVTHVGFGYAAGPGTAYGSFWVQHYGTGGHC